jgi:hypothetical protein
MSSAVFKPGQGKAQVTFQPGDTAADFNSVTPGCNPGVIFYITARVLVKLAEVKNCR